MHGLSLCKPCEGGKHIIAKAYVGAFELLDVKTKQGVSFFAKSEEVAIDELGNAVGKSVPFFKFIYGLGTLAGIFDLWKTKIPGLKDVENSLQSSAADSGPSGAKQRLKFFRPVLNAAYRFSTPPPR